MTKLIAIGGGHNGGDFDIEIEKKIYSFLPSKNASVIFVPYGAPDDRENYQEFTEIYEKFGCRVAELTPGREVELLSADLIYFGRGSTISLMETLKETKAIPFIYQAMEKGTILAGFSAGAHILFNTAGSYEENLGYILVDGLGLINGSMISHYNYQERAEAYHNLLAKNKINGIGLEDHTMLMVEGESISLYTSKHNANAYFITTGNDSSTTISLLTEENALTFNNM